MVVRERRLSVVAVVLLIAAACRRDDTAASAAAASASGSSAPDRLDPLELAEGSETVFRFKLPRGMRVTFRGPFEVHAEGPVEAERLANYVRKRMKSEGVEVGAARTVFDRARIRDDTEAPFCRVEVVKTGTGARIVLRDLTPEKIEDPDLPPEERWRKHGLDPNGRLVDPTHME